MKNSNLAFYFDGADYATLDSAVQACIDSLPNNNITSYIGTIKKGGQFRAFVQKYANINYASAILISYDLLTARYYRKSSGEWKNPVNFITNNDIESNVVEIDSVYTVTGSYSRWGNLIMLNITVNNSGNVFPASRITVGKLPSNLYPQNSIYRPISASVDINSTLTLFSNCIILKDGGLIVDNQMNTTAKVFYLNVVYMGG